MILHYVRESVAKLTEAAIISQSSHPHPAFDIVRAHNRRMTNSIATTSTLMSMAFSSEAMAWRRASTAGSEKDAADDIVRCLLWVRNHDHWTKMWVSGAYNNGLLCLGSLELRGLDSS